MTATLGLFSIVPLIFGGCCANVFALEAIIRYIQDNIGFGEDAKTHSSECAEDLSDGIELNAHISLGLLITFTQFLFTALASYPSQFSKDARYNVKPPQVPFGKWAIIAAMHFGINMLNNWAFAYNISVPVHIILRSFGSVTTMLAGVFRGKRYSKLQVLSVILLTLGVLVSAWADSERKGKSMSVESETSASQFVTGLGILLVAQFLSAFMGAYVEDTYAKYGANWVESLFYTHFLSLPLFLPISGSLRRDYGRLAATPPLDVSKIVSSEYIPIEKDNPIIEALSSTLAAAPQGLLLLSINTATQLACISGVNLLSAKSSAVTVTIVLNIRKLVSFIFSTILFGHQLTGKMVLGSTLVFGSGALYGWETSWRLPRHRKQKEEANGSLKKRP